MTGFEVDADAIERLAVQLDRYEGYAGEIARYVDEHQVRSTYEQVAGQGIIQYVLTAHQEVASRAAHRVSSARSVSAFASAGLRQAVRFYHRTDASVAARLDRTYPTIGSDPTSGLGAGLLAVAPSFVDLRAPRLTPPEGEDFDARGAELSKQVGGLFDLASISWWARQILLEVFGRDPFKDVIEFLSGDWQAIARHGEGWRQCAAAFRAMASNVAGADEAIGLVWRGNAADAAAVWLQQFAEATTREAEYFDYLAEVYRYHIEIAYWTYEWLNYLLGQLLDYVAELAAVFLTVPTGAGPLFVGIWAIIDQILFMLDSVRQIYHAQQAATAVYGAAFSSAGQEPTGLMETMLTYTDGPASYRHPAFGGN